MFKNLSPSSVGIKANFQQALDLARRFGFAGIDLPVTEIAALIDQRGANTIKDQFAAAGIKPAGFACPTNFRADEATWETGLKQLPRLARTAQAVGCTRCNAWIAPATDSIDYVANFELHVSRLTPIAKVLNDHGIRLGIEFVGCKSLRKNKRHEFIWNIEGSLELCDAIGTGNMGLALDAWHWHASRGSVNDLSKLAPTEVVSVQISDAPRGVQVDDLVDQVRDLPCSTGVINLAGFLETLKTLGYDGPVTPEPCRKDLATMPADQAAKLASDAMAAAWTAAGL